MASGGLVGRLQWSGNGYVLHQEPWNIDYDKRDIWRPVRSGRNLQGIRRLEVLRDKRKLPFRDRVVKSDQYWGGPGANGSSCW